MISGIPRGSHPSCTKIVLSARSKQDIGRALDELTAFQIGLVEQQLVDTTDAEVESACAKLPRLAPATIAPRPYFPIMLPEPPSAIPAMGRFLLR